MEDKFSTIAVYLSENDRTIIQEFAAENGLNFSSALRWIVREWARHCRPVTIKPDAHLEAVYEDRNGCGAEE